MKVEESDNLLDKYLKGEVNEKPDPTGFDVEISAENLGAVHGLFEQERTRNALRNEFKTMLRDRKPRRKLFYETNWFRVAAAITAMFVASMTFYLLSNKGNNYVALYDTYYQPYPVDANVRGINSSLKESIALYDLEKYNKVVAYYTENQFLANQGNIHTVLLGVSYLNTGRTEQAITLFERNTGFNEMPYRDYIQWYLGLAYLKNGNVDKARSVLNRVIEQNMIHSLKAREIIDQL